MCYNADQENSAKMAVLEKLVVRAQVLRRIRAFFDARDFIEVETPVRIPAPAPEPHIDCPAVVARPRAEDLSRAEFLRASPELQMKKLLCMGLPRIWQMGPCFREGEKGGRHSPEFTMLEWYRAHADYLDILRDMEALVADALVGTPGARRAAKNRRPENGTPVKKQIRIRRAGWGRSRRSARGRTAPG